MKQKLILVDYENIQKIDLSGLDDSYRAIIFVGAKQNPPKASRNKSTSHRFNRVDFHKIEGAGKNALDFHIAFHLGRTIETAPHTECFVLSRDKGFDPLLSHLNKNGLNCRRVVSLDELISQHGIVPKEAVCGRCGKASTIEHHGGRWCSNCGCFAVPADPAQLPSNQASYKEPDETNHHDSGNFAECGWCHQSRDMTGGIYDDGEWMCGDCIAGYT
jgi:ribosomal protein S27AE